MGRPKTYEREAVTRKAMELFWAQGYEATSTKILAAHMGINVYSLFAEFESKQGLYEAALDLYRREIADQRFGALAESEAGLEEIFDLLDTIVAYAKSRKSIKGCLMCNAATERAPSDRACAAIVSTHFDTNMDAIRNALENARARGEIDPATCCEEQSKALTATLVGLSVLMRAGVEARFIRDAVRAARNQLERLCL